MEVKNLIKRNIQPNIPLPLSEQMRRKHMRNSIEKSSITKLEYNNGPTKDVSFRGSAVSKAPKILSKAVSKITNKAPKAADEMKIPNYARKLVKSEKFGKVINKVLEEEAVIEAAIVLGLTTTIKPLATLIMPGASKEDKEVIATKHALSGLLGFGFSKLIFSPISKAANKVSKDPHKYLKGDTEYIKKLEKSPKLHECFDVIWKKGPDVLMSIPKSALTVALITPALAFLFPHHKKAQKGKKKPQQEQQSSTLISQKISNDKALTFKGREQQNNNKDLSFTGLKMAAVAEAAEKTGIRETLSKGYDKFTDLLAKGIGRISVTKPMKKLTSGLTHSKKPAPLLSNLASVVLTLSLLNSTAKSKTIEKERKPYLLLNTALVTAVSSTAATIVDFCSDGFLDSMRKAYMAEKFGFNNKQIEKGLKQLDEIKEFGAVKNAANNVLTPDNIKQMNKYMLGVNKLKSHTIFSFVVRFASPLLVVPLTTKILDVVSKYRKKNNGDEVAKGGKEDKKDAKATQPQQAQKTENTKKA